MDTKTLLEKAEEISELVRIAEADKTGARFLNLAKRAYAMAELIAAMACKIKEQEAEINELWAK